MEFALSPEQEMFRKSARAFALEELEPIAERLDKNHEFPIGALKKLGKLGYLGMTVPEDYGGSGADAVSYAIVMEELSRSCASTSTAVSVQNSLCNNLIVTFANEAQKKKYLPALASGEKIGAFALTEPESGSDAGSLKTGAVPKGDSFILNGAKRFITNAAFADIFLVFTSTDPKSGNKGVTCFLVEKGTKGFTVGKEEDKMGIHGTSTCELFFENCVLPKENIIGELNRGFRVAMVTLDAGRIGIAAQALGIAQAALDEALKYSRERKTFGKLISEHQAIQFMLADMRVKVEAARLLVYRSAWEKDAGLDYVADSSIAKLYASEIASEVADTAVQIHGGYGFIRDYKVERLYRDARITRLYEGTSEIQKLIISRDMLKA
ncbi:acyl-CoA dehydrogenase [Candidatus Acetothermia bacterium]|nr:acyl-CoA dehydrogenase [Candidatus Acetothermia bacterium]MBI3459422.1 acyl-CoA dehydrogenase [Candidatus Acetothermia bacterium]MBI3660557.1 acyl-CoA dehydrogenase [Candidatus Acetothermia bacterium]